MSRRNRILPVLVLCALALVIPASASAASGCDPLDPSACLLPWPDDYYTVPDASTPTGRRLNLTVNEMPKNKYGIPITPTDYNSADGFSPGAAIVTRVPGLDSNAALDASGAPTVLHHDRYMDPNSPIVVLDAKTGQRWPVWAEVDANPADPANRTLLIRPSVDFNHGGHYIVALRNLKTANGTPIEAQQPFKVYRDDLPSSDPAVNARRAHMEHLFKVLGNAGIERNDLYLAWDFHVASRQNITGRLLSMRNRAFAELGDTTMKDMRVQGSAPTFAVTGVQHLTPSENSNIARIVKGNFTVPCFLYPTCAPGGRFALGPDGLPLQNPVPWTADFECVIPRAAVGPGSHPARASLYGHGLFGDASEVEAGNVEAMANEHDFVFCGTDWIGMALTDIPNTVVTLNDLSNFPSLTDRLQQAQLDFMFLGRLMIHPNGLDTNAAFQHNGAGVIDRRNLFYDGNSQGGIEGGILTAVEPDLNRSVLGVPGMTYSLLVQRSSDFPPFSEGKLCQEVFDDCGPFNDTPLGLYDAYPDESQRQLILSMMQLLWDRGEPDGYAQYMTDHPLPQTPKHTVLMHLAFGDHQVTNVAAETEARTIGAYAHEPALDPGRIPGGEPLWDIPAIPSYPWGGSALVYWDSGPPRPGDDGVTNPPTTNTAPSTGRDPHGDPRSTPAARVQKSEFLRPNGAVVDVCGGNPCYSHGWTGAP
jgi:hypothetical protein